MKPDLPALLPAEFLRRPHTVTRFFYYDQKLARITCLIHHHQGGAESPHIQLDPQTRSETVYPASGGPRPPEHGDPRIYAITYVLAGRSRVRYKGSPTWHEVGPGDIYQFNGQQQSEIQLEPQAGFVECSFCLDAFTGRHLAELEIWDADCRIKHVGLREDVVRGYVDFYESIRRPEAPNLALLKDCIQLIELVHKHEELRERDAEFRDRACSLLAEHISPAASIAGVAQLMGMSYDSFRQRFRRLLGLSPVRYKLLLRLEKAKLLLERQSVKETAAALGYSDPSVFSRQFKKWIKRRPKDQRK